MFINFIHWAFNMIETWKDIKWYEWLYKISNTGRVVAYDRIMKWMYWEPKLHKWRELKKRITLWYNQVVLTYCLMDIERELWYDQWNISTACKKWCIRYWYKRELA